MSDTWSQVGEVESVTEEPQAHDLAISHQPNSIDSLQLTEQVARPWAKLDQAPVMLEKFKSDAGKRWKNKRPEPESERLVSLCASFSSAGPDSELRSEVEKTLIDLQEITQHAVSTMHTQSSTLAKTISEKLWGLGPQEELDEDISAETEQLKAHLTSQKLQLKHTEQIYQKKVAEIAREYKATSCHAPWFGFLAAVTALCATSAAALLTNFAGVALLFGISEHVEKVLSETQEKNLLLAWEKLTKSFAPDSIQLQAWWRNCLPVLFLGCCALCMVCTWKWHQLSKRSRLQSKLANSLDQCKQCTTENRLLWDVVDTAVDRVDTLVTQLKKLHPQRVERRKDTMIQIMYALFGMTLSVSEFIIYLEECGFFPPNFSSKNLVDAEIPESYEALREAMFSSVH